MSKIKNKLTPEVVEFLGRQRRVILACSGGKDSLTCWLCLRELGLEIQPCYYALIPGLSFVEAYLNYLERKLGVRVMRLQHPQTYHWLRTFAGQPPHRKTTIDLLKPPMFQFPDVNRGIRRTMERRDPGASVRSGVDWKDAYTCMGTRYVDSYHRRLAFKRKGWKRDDVMSCSPIHNFSKEDVFNVLKRSGVKVSPDYKMFGRSFDGIDYRFLKVVREDYPEDYAKILKWVPLAEAEFWRVKWAVEHGIAEIRS